MADLSQGENPVWGYTQDYILTASGMRLFEEKPFFSREKTFQGKRVIGHDTPIDRGVYLNPEEAIVVDSGEDNRLDDTFREFWNRYKPTEPGFKVHVLVDILQFVKEKLPYDKNKVDSFIKEKQLQFGKPVNLGEYIENGTGICRHQSLLAGFLIEQLTQDVGQGSNILGGKVSVDRSYIPNRGGHAWVRYENSGGQVFILDPAKDFVGTLEDAQKNGGWQYEIGRPNGIINRIRGVIGKRR